MTPICIKKVDDLQQESEAFCDLSVEQLLYAAISGTSKEDVLWALVNTDWENIDEQG